MKIESSSIEMKVETLDINSIIPYENNPRDNNDAAEVLSDSIKKYGFINPIIIDANNVIVAGHTRFKAAIANGMRSVPCIRVSDLSDVQLRAFRIMDNKAGEYSEWDFRKLNQELLSISELDKQETSDLEAMFGLAIGENLDVDELSNPHEKKEKPEQSEPDDEVVTCPYCGYSFVPGQEEEVDDETVSGSDDEPA